MCSAAPNSGAKPRLHNARARSISSTGLVGPDEYFWSKKHCFYKNYVAVSINYIVFQGRLTKMCLILEQFQSEIAPEAG
jgi:hypothetical protein